LGPEWFGHGAGSREGEPLAKNSIAYLRANLGKS